MARPSTAQREKKAPEAAVQGGMSKLASGTNSEGACRMRRRRSTTVPCDHRAAREVQDGAAAVMQVMYGIVQQRPASA
jgi:hypothetical protein